MATRREVITGLMGGALAAAIGSRPAGAASNVAGTELRGSIDAAGAGILPGASDNLSRRMQALLDEAAAKGLEVFLPPGNYSVSNLSLPDGTRLSGVPGATRLSYSGDGHLITAADAARIDIADIVLDGANRWLGDHTEALLSFRNVADLRIVNCEIAGSRKHAVSLERCGGRIADNRITGAALAALISHEGKALSVTGNHISDCGNGGILVHRWTKGADESVISGNRIARIAANDGGTGQNGNGINLFRADNVIVSDNHVSDCAFSAIRANSSSDVQITGNQCLRSGETAIFAEFAFEGAIISSNLVDGAANGIVAVNFNEGGRLASVSANVIRNLSLKGPYPNDEAGFGIGISVEADTAIFGNVIENAPRAGLMIGWGPYLRDVVASGNIIRNAPVGIAVSVVEGVGTAMLSGNLIDGAKDGAIVGYRWKERATGDLVAGGDAPAPLVVEGNRAL